MIRIIAILLLSCNIAVAQISQQTIVDEITANLPTNNQQLISAELLRNTLNQMTSAIFQNQGLSGFTITGTPSVGQAIIATSSSTASWQNIGGLVTSVSNNDGSLIINPNTGAVILSLNLNSPNSWGVIQNFNAGLTGAVNGVNITGIPSIGFVPIATSSTTAVWAQSVSCSGCISGNLVESSGGGLLNDAGISTILLTQAPQFTTFCNPTGITALPRWCDAVTALSPLNINTSTNVLSLTGIYTSNNLFFGFNSGNATGTGLNNVAFGFTTLHGFTSGGNNTAIGGNALQACTTCSQNMALGYNSMTALITGVNNVSIGYQAMLVAGVTGAANGNTGIGQQSFFALTTGAINTAVGAQACNALTTGQFNICIGGINSTGSHSVTTGSRNIIISSLTTGVTTGITTTNGNVVLGNITGLSGLTDAVVIGDGDNNIRFDYGKTTASTATITSATTAVTGAFVAATTLQSTTVYSAAGTALPTCNAGAEGTRAGVSDATGPTFNATYTSGGSVHTPVYCNGTNWITN